jgi:hypothetical protein
MEQITIEEERIAYYYQLGLALSAWTRLEAWLLGTILRCVPIAAETELTRNSLAMGFVSIQGARNKILFAGAMVRRTLAGHALAEEWEALQEKLLAESGKRNDLAHYQTQEFPNNTEGRRFALCPWSYPKGHDTTKPAPGSHCLKDIVVMRYSFETLNVKLANFLARACNQPAPFPISDEQPSNPPDLRQIANQIHAELGHPRKSSREKRLEEDVKNASASLNGLHIDPKSNK